MLFRSTGDPFSDHEEPYDEAATGFGDLGGYVRFANGIEAFLGLGDRGLRGTEAARTCGVILNTDNTSLGPPLRARVLHDVDLLLEPSPAPLLVAHELGQVPVWDVPEALRPALGRERHHVEGMPDAPEKASELGLVAKTHSRVAENASLHEAVQEINDARMLGFDPRPLSRAAVDTALVIVELTLA